MAEKELNIIKTLEEEILKHPEAYKTTFMVDTSNWKLREFYLKTSMVKSSNWKYPEDPINYIKDSIGEAEIQRVQVMTGDVMTGDVIMVTMNNVDVMNDLLASVTGITYRNFYILTFVSVLPVPARVRIRISDIPLPLALANMKDIKELFIELVKELKDVMLSLEKVGDMQTGNLIVDAMTHDLKVTHGKLKSNAGIKYKNFHGTVKFIKSFPVREESNGKYQDKYRIKYNPWE